MRRLIEKEKLGLLATRLGLPVADLLDVARWFTGKSCTRCQIYSEILHKINKIGYTRAEHLIKELAAAHKANDLFKLAAIQREIPK